MAGKAARPAPRVTERLTPVTQHCPACGHRLWADYRNRRCRHRDCTRRLKPYRPEVEGRYALSRHEFGLDVVALFSALRYGEHRSVSEINQRLKARGLAIAERTVANPLDRYDELLAVA